MYIHPFVCGIIATILVEVGFITACVIVIEISANKGRK